MVLRNHDICENWNDIDNQGFESINQLQEDLPILFYDTAWFIQDFWLGAGCCCPRNRRRRRRRRRHIKGEVQGS